jgi:hypothetical protein
MFLRHFPPGVVIIKRTSIIFHSTYPICLCKALFVSFFGFFCFLNTSTGACLIKPLFTVIIKSHTDILNNATNESIGTGILLRCAEGGVFQKTIQPEQQLSFFGLSDGD